jgi:hypothetical protein
MGAAIPSEPLPQRARAAAMPRFGGWLVFQRGAAGRFAFATGKIGRHEPPGRTTETRWPWSAGQFPRFGVTLLPLAGKQWIQVDDRQETRLPTSRKVSTIESIPHAGI